ncbi:MAG: dTMP kinase [Candidatus Marinimicrobia bacterium]|nr:dTMP kinase [Candidatus Neomarinimicrobiota bacterium]
MDHKGLFLTFEGLDGCGKSTQVHRTASLFRNAGFDVLELRDPGSTSIGETVREILLNPKYSTMDAVTELLLFAVARSQMVAELILPALDKGTIVLSDRFYDSTTAYQGYGRQLNLELVLKLNAIGAHNLVPNLTFIFDISPQLSTERMMLSGKLPDRLENEKMTFHERVRKGYLEIAQKEPTRCCIIDGKKSEEAIQENIYHELIRRKFL